MKNWEKKALELLKKAFKSVDRLIGTSPESRNQILTQAFRRYHLCEERGTGFVKTILAIELFGLPPLKFEQGENYFKVILSSPRKFADMSRNVIKIKGSTK